VTERLSVEQVIRLNEIECVKTGESPMLLDRPGLEAAVDRPWGGGFGVGEFYPSLYEKAAALLHGIASRQTFENGNKRTAWIAAVTFLDINGVDIGFVETVLSDMFVRAAALDHTLEIADIAEWFEVVARTRDERLEMSEVIKTPEHLVGGTYASGWRVSHTGETFMLDFLVADDRAVGEEYIVVDRVRVPAYVVEQMLGVLQDQWERYLSASK
jgi:death-on-curing protein